MLAFILLLKMHDYQVLEKFMLVKMEEIDFDLQ